MKKTYIFPLYAAMIATVLSCSMEDNLVSGGMEVNLSAGISYAPTKAGGPYDMGYSGSLEIQMLRWDANSTITGNSPLDATLGSPDTNNGYLRDITFGTRQYYPDRTSEIGFIGWYPGTSEGMSYDPDSRVLQYAVNTGDTDVMISNFVKGNYETGIPAVEFSHVLCQYSVAIYAVDETARQQWEERFGKITGITISGFPGTLAATIPETPDGTTTVEYEGTAPQTYTITDSNTEMPVGIGNKETVGKIIMAAPAIDEIVTITVKFSGGEQKQIAMSREFLAGYKYSFSLRFSHNGLIEPESSIDEWFEIDTDFNINNGKTYYNLSQYGTANCYIVSSANASYCFDCTVKGNGVNSVTDYYGNTFALPDNDVNIVPDSIGIIRSSAVMKKQNGSFVLIPDNPDSDYNERTDTEILTLDTDAPREGRVLFTVKGNTGDASDHALIYKGNVLIGAFSGETLLWSWHIWITDRPDTQGYGNGFSSLDRNLGAVMSDSEGFSEGDIAYTGLYYQWGRKDPMFPAPFNSGGQQWPVWGVEQSEHPASSGSAASVEETVRHPMTYYFDGSGGNGWLSASDSRYSNYDHFWGYISVRDDIKKTIYDPCPPGYRVPGNALWEDPDPGMRGEPVTSDGTANGHFAGYQFTINDMIEIYYPSTSCITVEKGQVVEKYHDNIDIEGNPVSSSSVVDDFVFMYSATPYEPGESDSDNFHDLAYHFRYNQDELGESYTRVMTADPDNYHVKRADAYPVRCVFENSAPVVTDLSEAQTANSYIISSSGFYEFDASVRGNGVSELTGYIDGNVTSVTISAGLSDVISDAHHVDVLWWQGDLSEGSHYREIVERTGNMSDDQISELIDAECPVIVYDDGLLVDGKPLIRVVTNDNTYGNVGLAVYDRSGKILWSWHIWIQKDVGTVSFGELTLMDRNLGATYHDYPNLGQNNTAASYGFYYQWGRKDPFFKPDQVWFEKTDDGWKRRIGNITDTKGEILESVQNPLTFFKGNSINDNTWQTTYSSGGNNPALPRLWGYVGGVNATGASYAKTMYDPCPPGYRILQHNAFGLANICDADQENEYTFLWNNTNAIYFDNSTYLQNKGYADARGIWFPNAGYIDWNGTSGTDNVSKLSLSTANAAGAYCREIRWRRNNNQYYAISQKSNAAGDVRPYMCLGRVVRCQME